MKILIKHRYAVSYIDFTQYVEMPISMTQTVDGTFHTIDLKLLTPKKVGNINTAISIPPKYILKFTEVDDEALETSSNTFYFLTGDNNKARRRKEILDGNDNVAISALYTHEVTAESLIRILDNRNLPNYTITQPKTEFFSSYTRTAGYEFRLQQRFQQDGGMIDLVEGVGKELAYSNNESQELTFGYDNVKGHYVEFNELSETSLTTTFQIDLAKTAPSYFDGKIAGIFNDKGNFRVFTGEIPSVQIHSTSDFYLQTVVEKYDFNNEIISRDPKQNTIKYNGGLVSTTRLPRYITSLSNVLSQDFVVIVDKDETVSKVRVYIRMEAIRRERNEYLDGASVQTRINGYSDNDFVKVLIDRMVIKSNTGSYNRTVDEKKTTLLEFVEKAIFDYNFNSRQKVTLNDDVRVLLDVVAKESEWGDYTLRELLERAFKYVGLVPILNPDYSISYTKTNKVSRFINLQTANDEESEHTSDDYYDKVVSTSKNLVSQEDFVTEFLPVVSVDDEFSQITDISGGFKTSNDIYFVSTGILYTPNLVIDFGQEKITSNMGKPYYWDITRRFFESEIYNSFPNVRLDYETPSGTNNPRSYFGLLGKGNTIYYQSGGNTIGGIFNQAEEVPEFVWQGNAGELIASIWSTYALTKPVAEYAVIEMIIMLAYEMLQNPNSANTPKPNIDLKDIVEYELQLTYCPIFNEVTTKYTSNMNNRKALNWEKKLNISDKTISYQNNEEVLRTEMERKGNVKNLFSETYRSIDESIPVNSVVNDNLYVTTKNILIYNNIVEVDYVLQENFILQNEDIRLSVEFERYNVPYEFVVREIYIDNHMIFSQTPLPFYVNEASSVTKQFIERTLLAEGLAKINSIEGALYNKLQIDDGSYLQRVAKLESRFTMLLNGKFVDNYTAGLQRYDNGVSEMFYTEPLRYTNGNGKFSSLFNLELGFSDITNPIRLARRGYLNYDIKKFPVARYGGYDVDLQVKLINLSETLMIRKDARESVVITHTSFLETDNDKNIKFYNFKAITGIGYLTQDVSLNDNLTLQGIDFVKYTGNFTLELRELSANSFMITVITDDISLFADGMVLYNEKDENEFLVGVVKEPIINGDRISFYIYATRYGSLESDERESLYISIGVNQLINTSYQLNNIETIDIDIKVKQQLAINNLNRKVEMIVFSIGAMQQVYIHLDEESVAIINAPIRVRQNLSLVSQEQVTQIITAPIKLKQELMVDYIDHRIIRPILTVAIAMLQVLKLDVVDDDVEIINATIGVKQVLNVENIHHRIVRPIIEMYINVLEQLSINEISDVVEIIEAPIIVKQILDIEFLDHRIVRPILTVAIALMEQLTVNEILDSVEIIEAYINVKEILSINNEVDSELQPIIDAPIKVLQTIKGNVVTNRIVRPILTIPVSVKQILSINAIDDVVEIIEATIKVRETLSMDYESHSIIQPVLDIPINVKELIRVDYETHRILQPITNVTIGVKQNLNVDSVVRTILRPVIEFDINVLEKVSVDSDINRIIQPIITTNIGVKQVLSVNSVDITQAVIEATIKVKQVVTDNTNTNTIPMTPTTATPTVGIAHCLREDMQNKIYISVTNNDISTVTIRNYGSNKTTLGAGQSTDVLLGYAINTPINYDYSITAIANGKNPSTPVSGSQRIIFCLAG